MQKRKYIPTFDEIQGVELVEHLRPKNEKQSDSKTINLLQ